MMRRDGDKNLLEYLGCDRKSGGTQYGDSHEKDIIHYNDVETINNTAEKYNKAIATACK